MSLTILSERFEPQEKTFKNVALASLNAKLDFSARENSKRKDGAIEIWVTKRYGVGEDDYDFFSMDIRPENHAANFMREVKYKDKYYYPLAGTDNAPLFICYHFSLAYLRIEPSHKISYYDDCVFGLEEIESIESKTGFSDDWVKLICK